MTHQLMLQPLLVSLPRLAVNQRCCLALLRCLLDQACIEPYSCQHQHPAELPAMQLDIFAVAAEEACKVAGYKQQCNGLCFS